MNEKNLTLPLNFFVTKKTMQKFERQWGAYFILNKEQLNEIERLGFEKVGCKRLNGWQ